MRRRNPNVEIDDDVIDVDEGVDPTEFAPWYKQFMKIEPLKRKKIAESALEKIKEAKPETFEFIKKFKCSLVGLCPGVEYALFDEREGDIDVTYIHAFSLPTLLYWCESGKFGFFVNANLDYNDTVLNRVKGNRKDSSIRGFTA